MKLLNFLIPRWLKKFDQYLLLHQPQVWVTKIHFALFFVLIFDAIVFGLTYYLYPVSLKDYSYWRDYETPLLMMILPAIALYVGWFVFQSWYNVDKNFGKLSIKQDYLNFIFYWIIAIAFYSIVVMIPHGMHQKISSQIHEDQIKQDFEHLVKCSAYFDESRPVEFTSNQYIVWQKSSFDWEKAEQDRNYFYDFEYDEDVTYKKVHLNESEILEDLGQLREIAEKYAVLSPQGKKQLSDGYFIDDLRLRGTSSFSTYEIMDQVWDLYQIKNNEQGFPLWNSIYLKIVFAITGILAMITWIFKNVHWKNFIASMIIHILTPFIIGIIALAFYLTGTHNEEEGVFFLVIIATTLSLILMLIPWLQQKHNSVGIISAIVLQTWLPFLPVIFLGLYYEVYGNYFHTSEQMEQTYYVGLILTLVSLPFFKTYYQRMWALPKKK